MASRFREDQTIALAVQFETLTSSLATSLAQLPPNFPLRLVEPALGESWEPVRSRAHAHEQISRPGCSR